MKIHKNDNVMILAGKDKGKTGPVDKVFPVLGKVVVKGVALAKKHVKPSKKNPQGGIIDLNMKINVSNVAIVCPSCGKATRVGYKLTDNNKKIRICKKCGESIESVAK